MTIIYILRDGSSLDLLRMRLSARQAAREYGQDLFPNLSVPRAFVTTAFMAGYEQAMKEVRKESAVAAARTEMVKKESAAAAARRIMATQKPPQEAPHKKNDQEEGPF